MGKINEVYIVCTATTRNQLRVGRTYVCSSIEDAYRALEAYQKELPDSKYYAAEKSSLKRFLWRVSYDSPRIWVATVDSSKPMKAMKIKAFIERLEQAGLPT